MIQTRLTTVRQKLSKIESYVAVYNHDQFTQEAVDELVDNVRSILIEIRDELQAVNQELNNWHA